jgi:hypothetical protein
MSPLLSEFAGKQNTEVQTLSDFSKRRPAALPTIDFMLYVSLVKERVSGKTYCKY